MKDNSCPDLADVADCVIGFGRGFLLLVLPLEFGSHWVEKFTEGNVFLQRSLQCLYAVSVVLSNTR